MLPHLLPNPRLLTTARIAKQTLKDGAKPERIVLEVELAEGSQPGRQRCALPAGNCREWGLLVPRLGGTRRRRALLTLGAGRTGRGGRHNHRHIPLRQLGATGKD